MAIQYFGFGTAFKSDKSTFCQFGFAEKSGTDGIQFFILSSKLPKFRGLEIQKAKELHELFRGSGSYKDSDVLGVKTLYVTEENVDFIKKCTGINLE